MALSQPQRRIMDAFFDHGELSIKEIQRYTGYSGSFLRVQLELMKNNLDVDKRRQPYTYNVAAESAEFKIRKAVERAKAELLSSDDSKNVFVKSVKSMPSKESWIDAVSVLRAVAQAIEELDADGLLIDTLEV